MSITVVTTLHCEHKDCMATIANTPNAKASARQLRKEAKDMEWSRVGGKDFCANHKPVWKKILVPSDRP